MELKQGNMIEEFQQHIVLFIFWTMKIFCNFGDNIEAII